MKHDQQHTLAFKRSKEPQNQGFVGGTISAMQGTAIFKIKFGTEVVQVVPNWRYRNGTGGGPEHDIAFRVVPKWTGTETDHPVVPKWSGTERDLPRIQLILWYS